MLFHIFLDALVWNFSHAKRYSLDRLFMRAGGKTIVTKYSALFDPYIKYLSDIEQKKTGIDN
jgi:hypothetical protein